MTIHVAVFASGGGTNLAALFRQEESQAYWRIQTVVSDRPGAEALERAHEAGRLSHVIPVEDRPSEEVADETLAYLAQEGVQVVLLAGYLRLVPEQVVRFFHRRMLNVHPALLPAFGGPGLYGIRVHQAVLESGARVSGPSVHFVSEEYDRGSILAQWPVPVRDDDTPESLQKRVLAVEHILYPLAADHLCRAVARGQEVAPLSPPGEAFTSSADVTAEELAKLIRGAF